MGLLDGLSGGDRVDIEALRREVANLKDLLRKATGERDQLRGNYTKQLDQTHALILRLKALVSCLISNQIMERTWDLLENALAIRKGGIFMKNPAGWKPVLTRGFDKDPAPVIPLDEESLATHAAKHGIGLTLAHIRANDELNYLERRGVIPDAKLVAPVWLRGSVQGLLIICTYGGNVFSSDDDFEIVTMVGSLLGLVIQNTQIVFQQKAQLEQKKQELTQKDQELLEKTKQLDRVRNLFSRMVAPEVIQAIEKNPRGIVLGGSRQRVAIFFADVRGFTRLAERMPPERVVDLLNQYFSNLTDIVLKYRGTLDKFMGDGAMVLFGTPLPLASPCHAAIATAIEVQRMVIASVKKWVANGFPAFSLGIGLNYEDVVVGQLGSPRLSNFTAVGDGVNMASRLCGLALGGEVLVSESFFAELKGWKAGHEVRSGVAIKGRSEACTVHSLWVDEQAGFEPCPGCDGVLDPSGSFCASCGYRGIGDPAP